MGWPLYIALRGALWVCYSWLLWVGRFVPIAVGWSLWASRCVWSVALSVGRFIRGIVGGRWIGGFMLVNLCRLLCVCRFVSVAVDRLMWLIALCRSMWVSRSGLGALGR